MPIETERRPSGIWTVLYQPDIPSKTIDRYQEMFDFLGNTVINGSRFNSLKIRNRACFEVTFAFAGPTNSILNRLHIILDFCQTEALMNYNYYFFDNFGFGLNLILKNKT